MTRQRTWTWGSCRWLVVDMDGGAERAVAMLAGQANPPTRGGCALDGFVRLAAWVVSVQPMHMCLTECFWALPSNNTS